MFADSRTNLLVVSWKVCQGLTKLELLSPAKPLHFDRANWKYLVALSIEKIFNRGTRKAYNTMTC